MSHSFLWFCSFSSNFIFSFSQTWSFQLSSLGHWFFCVLKCAFDSLVNFSLKFFYLSASELLCDVLIFPLCSYIIFLTFSMSFSFLRSLTVFQNHSLVDLPSGLCHWTFSVVLFFECVILPCFLMCLVIFFPWKLGCLNLIIY